MFQSKGMLFLYTETLLHAGSGRGFGAVDLPIQREISTGYPFIQAGSIKGRLRAEAESVLKNSQAQQPQSPIDQEENKILAIFGPETNEAHTHAGSLSIGDARLVLFPVRSLKNVFAYVTSFDVLSRFAIAAERIGIHLTWKLPEQPPAENVAWVNGDSLVISGNTVVLEEFGFTSSKEQEDLIKNIGGWFGTNALLDGDEYQYFRTNIISKLCILSDSAFRNFVTYNTEIQTHIHLDAEKKTVLTGQLWTVESLPFDSLLYAPLVAYTSRRPNVTLTAEETLKKVCELVSKSRRLNFGGDETTGQGIASVRCWPNQRTSEIDQKEEGK